MTKQMKVSDITTIEEARKFRAEVLRPMEQGETRRSLRNELNVQMRRIHLEQLAKQQAEAEAN